MQKTNKTRQDKTKTMQKTNKQNKTKLKQCKKQANTEVKQYSLFLKVYTSLV